MWRSMRLAKLCSTDPEDKIFVKSYGFLSFAKNMGKYLQKDKQKLKW